MVGKTEKIITFAPQKKRGPVAQLDRATAF